MVTVRISHRIRVRLHDHLTPWRRAIVRTNPKLREFRFRIYKSVGSEHRENFWECEN